jgi:hypothetical protein
MKITQTTLRKIIREELSRVNEMGDVIGDMADRYRVDEDKLRQLYDLYGEPKYYDDYMLFDDFIRIDAYNQDLDEPSQRGREGRYDRKTYRENKEQ